MRRVLVAIVSSAAVWLACTLEVEGPVGKRCVTANDCSPDLVCVAARPGEGRTCEALALPAEGNIAAPDAGVAYYCDAAKPVLDTYCVTCHGVPPAQGVPGNFRLDVYTVDDGGAGAFDYAERAYIRTVRFRDMPPPEDPQPSEEERQVIAAWYLSGAQFCNDGGSTGEMMDAGMETDAGM